MLLNDESMHSSLFDFVIFIFILIIFVSIENGNVNKMFVFCIVNVTTFGFVFLKNQFLKINVCIKL